MIIMPQTSPIQVRQDFHVSSRSFLITLKHWMGHLFTTCGNLSFKLYKLICKTKNATQPVFDNAQPNDKHQLTSPGKVEVLSKSQTTKLQAVPNPLSKEENDDELVTDEEGSTIIYTMFTTMGFDSSLEEILTQATPYDLDGNELTSVDFKNLTGDYQLEWTLDNHILIYTGGFNEGAFHGKGTFFNQDVDCKLHLLLSGRFDQGEFASGLVVLDNSYLEGTYSNGELIGTGIIQEFPLKEEDNNSCHIGGYRGSFLNATPHGAIPHGQGLVYAVSSVGVEIVEMGEYANGKLLKGLRKDNDGLTFRGQFDSNGDFKGIISNAISQWHYEGEWKKGQFNGKGQWNGFNTYEYEDLEIEESDQGIMVQKSIAAFTTSNGVFLDGKIHNGETSIVWPENDIRKTSTFTIEEGEILDTEIITRYIENDVRSGMKYHGKFTPGTLDGKGTIFIDDIKVYEGEIKCGYPHGKGIRFEGKDSLKEGQFQYGTFIG